MSFAIGLIRRARLHARRLRRRREATSSVLWQPYEFIIIGGSALGTFIVANPLPTIKDTGKAVLEAIKGAAPKERDYLDLLGLLYVLMRELRGNGRNALEEPDRQPQGLRALPAVPEGRWPTRT